MKHIWTFLKSEDGPTAVEYAVMLAMILMSIIGSISILGAASSGMWGKNQSQLEAHGF
jgi:pilus assembly protein Flp/PilA